MNRLGKDESWMVRPLQNAPPEDLEGSNTSVQTTDLCKHTRISSANCLKKVSRDNLYKDSYILVVLVLAGLAVSRKLPSYINRCSTKDPNIDSCLRKASVVIKPYLEQGIPELRIPLMNPLVFPYIALNTGDSFDASFKDIRIYGMESFELEELHFDFDKNRVDLKLFFPLVRITSVYKLQGRILILQLNGFGNSDGNFTNLHCDVAMVGKREIKKGNEYFRFDDVKLDIKFKKANMYFENIFKNNEELTSNTNRIISENIQEIFVELRPMIDETATKFIMGTLGELFARYSIDDLFSKT